MKRLLLIVLPMLLLLVQCASEDSVESMLIGEWKDIGSEKGDVTIINEDGTLLLKNDLFTAGIPGFKWSLSNDKKTITFVGKDFIGGDKTIISEIMELNHKSMKLVENDVDEKNYIKIK